MGRFCRALLSVVGFAVAPAMMSLLAASAAASLIPLSYDRVVTDDGARPDFVQYRRGGGGYSPPPPVYRPPPTYRPPTYSQPPAYRPPQQNRPAPSYRPPQTYRQPPPAAARPPPVASLPLRQQSPQIAQRRLPLSGGQATTVNRQQAMLQQGARLRAQRQSQALAQRQRALRDTLVASRALSGSLQNASLMRSRGTRTPNKALGLTQKFAVAGTTSTWNERLKHGGATATGACALPMRAMLDSPDDRMTGGARSAAGDRFPPGSYQVAGLHDELAPQLVLHFTDLQSREDDSFDLAMAKCGVKTTAVSVKPTSVFNKKVLAPFERQFDRAEARARAYRGPKVILGEYGGSVLTRQYGYEKAVRNSGAKIFSVPTRIYNSWTEDRKWEANRKFLDKYAQRRARFFLTTPNNMTTSNKREGSTFRREIQHLTEVHGYKLSPDGSYLYHD